ncbi:PKD domain-containing protein [Halovenus sp. HT40]|uniref:PKD domain-containing protein n=1 Tax=Halovenus sp. HT40 TaxID=3126691 RepID=UPI00300EF95E
MRSRTIHVVVVVLAVAGLLTVGVGSVAASHGEDVDDKEIVEVQTVSDDPEQGIVQVELRYHIGSDVAGMQTEPAGSNYEVVGTNGFEITDGAGPKYEWDKETSDPTIDFRVPINETAGDAYDYVDAGDWVLTKRPLRTDILRGAIGYDPAQIEINRLTTAGEEGVAADGMIYLGAYESYEFSSADEQFELVVSDAADPDWTVAEIRERLIATSDRFDVGAKSDRVTVFAVTDPLREGGLATSTNAAFWVHQAGLTESQTTLFHEYVHSRQDYDRTEAVEWTIEGSADYYGKLLALKDGTIEYHRFHHLLEQGNEYDDAILADRDSWAGTRANYELGALTIATMDERLRDDGATYADIFREKNAVDSQITDSDFESLAVDRDGDMADFFDQHIRSTPPEMSVPDPTVYDGPNTGATLALSVPELDLATGETERVTVTLANTGSESSLAPQLSADASDAVTVSLADSDGSGVTETDEGWVFDHLPAGERYELTLTVEAEATDGEQIQFSAGDLSKQRDSVSVTLDSSESIAATLDTPAEGTAGETINATAATTPADADIADYSFTITGPGGEQTLDTSVPTVTFTPEESGEYTVSVTATAADGRTATANRFVDVAPAETDDESTGEESTDDGTTDDNSTDDSTDGDSTDDDTGADGSDETADDGMTETVDGEPDEPDGTSDGFGDGFGPAVVVGGILALTLLARRRSH